MSKKFKKPKRVPSEPWRETLAWGKQKWNGSVENMERPGPLDRDARFLSPARRLKRFEEIRDTLCRETVWGRPVVKEWVKGDTRRLYWPDGSYLFIEPTGEVRTSGGEATKAKFEHRLI